MRDKSANVVLTRDQITFAGDAAGLENFFKLEHWHVRVGDRESDRIVWRRGDFVLVVAVTPEKKIVTIREYKQAAQKFLLGLPAGAVRGRSETSYGAAVRELREERRRVVDRGRDQRAEVSQTGL